MTAPTEHTDVQQRIMLAAERTARYLERIYNLLLVATLVVAVLAGVAVLNAVG